MRLPTLPTIAALLALGGSAAAQPRTGAPRFDPAEFRAHVEFLASDLLEGRDAGTRGYDLAAHYVATRFQSLGLRPAVAGGFLQHVPFVEYRINEGARLQIGGRGFVNGESVLIRPVTSEQRLRLTAPAVFAGYGLDLPGQGFDDYRGLDVRGKIAVVFSGFPPGTASELGAHLARQKVTAAAKRGAIGVIMVRTRAEARRVPWDRQRERGASPVLTWLAPDGRAHESAPGLRFQATLDTPAAEALFAGAPRSFARLAEEAGRRGARPKGFALTAPVRIDAASTARQTRSPNVVAVLPGSDPKLAGEHVLLMAHLDHIGLSRSPTGDPVNNGAMDNAAGVATLLEVAKAMRADGARPRRSIVFAAVTAEEDGLLGSQYLAKNPLPGAGRTVGVVNLDMPVLLYDFSDVIAFGGEHSTLGALASRAAGGMGLKVSPDPIPEEGIFTRSDHYRFVEEGIPAIFLMTGFAGEGERQFRDFLKTHYHQPSDQTSLPFDWNAGAKFSALNYAIAREIANAPERPRWYAGNFFGDTFAAGQPRAKATR